MQRSLVLLSLIASSSACFDDRTAPLDGEVDRPVIDEPSWDVPAGRVAFEWRWEGEVDAFNAIVSRNGESDPQVELSDQTRTMVVDVRGAGLVALSVQACVKGILKSTCTPWSRSELRAP